jgi:hypothetical protein
MTSHGALTAFTMVTGVLHEMKSGQGTHGIHHPPPSDAEVANEYSYTSTPHLCLHGMLYGELYPFIPILNFTCLQWRMILKFKCRFCTVTMLLYYIIKN